MTREMNDLVRIEYPRRLKLVAKSRFCADNFIKGVNTWVVSVIRYNDGIVDWTDKECSV